MQRSSSCVPLGLMVWCAGVSVSLPCLRVAVACVPLLQNSRNVLVSSCSSSDGVDMCAKVADLGLSRCLSLHKTHQTTDSCGTMSHSGEAEPVRSEQRGKQGNNQQGTKGQTADLTQPEQQGQQKRPRLKQQQQPYEEQSRHIAIDLTMTDAAIPPTPCPMQRQNC